MAELHGLQMGVIRSPRIQVLGWSSKYHHFPYDTSYTSWLWMEKSWSSFPASSIRDLDRSPKWRSQKNPNPWKNKTTNNLKEPMCWHICVFCCFKHVNHQPVLPFLNKQWRCIRFLRLVFSLFFLNRRGPRKFHLSLWENQLGWRKATN